MTKQEINMPEYNLRQLVLIGRSNPKEILAKLKKLQSQQQDFDINQSFPIGMGAQSRESTLLLEVVRAEQYKLAAVLIEEYGASITSDEQYQLLKTEIKSIGTMSSWWSQVAISKIQEKIDGYTKESQSSVSQDLDVQAGP